MAVPQSNGAAPAPAKAKSLSQKRRDKKKAQAKKPKEQPVEAPRKVDESAEDDGVQIVYVEAPMPVPDDNDENPIFEDFKSVFQKFRLGGGEEKPSDAGGEAKEGAAGEGAGEGGEGAGGENKGSDSESEDEKGKDDNEEAELSKKKKKLARQMRIAELKQQCSKPEVVEVWDVTAQDPTLLVELKATRNTVPVPRHWCQKRKFLQGKRGIEKPPWQLPDFIEATGISTMRQAYLDKESDKKLKQKQRDKMQPKMGKMDIDYQVLHDAFFRYQTKPKMTGVGEVYYEGKEFEANHEHIKPGKLSEDLREALGMPPGAPPPWLIYMQRYGPPPSYPNLKIQGLNAPIPEGCRFGYEPGEWGKPPVDAYGRPIYGDVFGSAHKSSNPWEAAVNKSLRWGDLQEEEESEEESEEEEEEDDDLASHAGTEATEDQTGTVSSLPGTGLETPDTIDLRKKTADRPLYQVLEEKEASVGGAMMGSSHTYVIPGATASSRAVDKLPAAVGAGVAKAKVDVSVTLRPEELEGLDEDAIKAKYEAFHAAAAAEANADKEDFSDLVAAQASKQKRKAAAKESEKAKKHKEFKF